MFLHLNKIKIFSNSSADKPFYKHIGPTLFQFFLVITFPQGKQTSIKEVHVSWSHL